MEEEEATGEKQDPDLHTEVHHNGDLHDSDIRSISRLSFKPFCLLNDQISGDVFMAEEFELK